MSTLDEEFQLAVDYIKNSPPTDIALSDSQKLQIYALYKQATEGPCNTSRPGMFDFTGRAKWDAWNNLGSMTSNEAKQKYIEELDQLSPKWRYYSKSNQENHNEEENDKNKFDKEEEEEESSYISEQEDDLGDEEIEKDWDDEGETSDEDIKLFNENDRRKRLEQSNAVKRQIQNARCKPQEYSSTDSKRVTFNTSSPEFFQDDNREEDETSELIEENEEEKIGSKNVMNVSELADECKRLEQEVKREVSLLRDTFRQKNNYIADLEAEVSALKQSNLAALSFAKTNHLEEIQDRMQNTNEKTQQNIERLNKNLEHRISHLKQRKRAANEGWLSKVLRILSHPFIRTILITLPSSFIVFIVIFQKINTKS